MTFRKKVSAIVFNSDGDILLGKYCPNYKNRSKIESSSRDNKRTFPGGGKEHNEKFRDALYRELHEEVNISSKYLEFVYAYKHPFYRRYQSKTKERFGKYRHTYIQGKKQRFFVLFYSGDKDAIKTSNTNEFCNIQRVKLQNIEQHIGYKITNFLNKEKLKKIIEEYNKKTSCK